MSAIVLTSETLIGTPAPGNIEYNGQFFGTDSNASRAQLQRIVQGTAVASTSGTSIDFTGIPAWVKKITVMFSGVSTNGTSNMQIQLGAGSVTTSGYAGSVSYGGSGATTFNSTGLQIYNLLVAAQNYQGAVTLTLLGSNTWVSVGNLAANASSATCFSAGAIALSGTLDRVRITTVNGTDTFDAGSVNIIYEG
jgi:hypothetical protein